MPISAIALRIWHQLRHDHRTLALMFLAPLLILTLIFFILDDNTATLKVAVTNVPQNYVLGLEREAVLVQYTTASDAHDALLSGEVQATVNKEGTRWVVEMDGSDASKSQQVLLALTMAMQNGGGGTGNFDIRYIYGYEDMVMFDNFGPVLIGFIIFFFVFLIAGISFLQERTTGTLEKLLSMPIKRWQIVVGYALGFGLVTVVQSLLISWYAIYILGCMMVGAFWLVMLITTLSALCALTLGILVSTVANNEFQMIQFIPIVIIPQFFFAGLFDLSPTLEKIGHFMPLYYVADALKAVMIKGSEWQEIYWDLLIIAGCAVFFMIANTLLLKKYRRI